MERIIGKEDKEFGSLYELLVKFSNVHNSDGSSNATESNLSREKCKKNISLSPDSLC